MGDSRVFSGRRKIFSDYETITAENVVDMLNKTNPVHALNAEEIDYLYKYYKGEQPILKRVKEIRPEICNKIVENHANEIVSFKVGYLMGEPIQYISHGKDDVTEEINELNEFCFAEDKLCKDRELADWFSICGTSFRMVVPDKKNELDDSPFEIYTLNPKNTYVVYWSGLGNKPVAGVTFIERGDKNIVYCVYTPHEYFEIINGKITNHLMHEIGDIPIVEYPANEARLGAFEPVLSILDAINTTASNRIDGIEQFIQAILVLKGVDLEDEQFKQLREQYGLKLPIEGDAKYLVQELNQTQTQTLVDYMYQQILIICGMPNRNGGSSTSDTGAAVIMRDGWEAAEARAKSTETIFKKSEKQFLKIALNIANTFRDMNLKLSQIEIRFTRRNYENISEKATVLTTMLSSDKIHPKLAFSHCGMFADPEAAYTMSEAYSKEREKQDAKDLENFYRLKSNDSRQDDENQNDNEGAA